MKKAIFITLILSVFLISYSDLGAQNPDKNPDIENKNNYNNSGGNNSSGMWVNNKLFHIDGGGGASFSFFTTSPLLSEPLFGLFMSLLSFRIDAVFDFSFRITPNINIGYEQGISFMTFEFLNSDGASSDVMFTSLDLKFRLFCRFAFGNYFIQIYGGYFLPVLAGISTTSGSVNVNEITWEHFQGAEVGIRFAMSNFTIDATYIFTKNSDWHQLRVGLGFLLRIL